MPERTTVTQVVQLGVEATPGVAVPANRKLPSLTIEPSIKTNVDVFRPLGNKYPTIAAQGKEWSEAKITGVPTYSELEYVFASLFAYAAPVQQGATTAYLWTHDPSSTVEDTIKTYTVERGSALRADKVTNLIIPELTLSGSRESIELTGMGLAKLLSDGISLTAAPTEIEQIPILAKEIDVYVDPTFGAIGSTKLTRLLKWSASIKSRFGPLWVVDSAQTSWVTHIETAVEGELKLMVEANSEGMDFLPRLRDGITRFVKIKGTSAQLAGVAFPYAMDLDLAVKCTDVSDFSDEDGVYAIEFTFRIVHDAGWTRAARATFMNKQTTL